MGYVYIEKIISDYPSSALGDAVTGFCSLVDDILTRFFRLTTYISHQFIQFVEDLVLRDADRYTDDFVRITSGYPKNSSHSICRSVVEDSSLSPQPYISPGSDKGAVDTSNEVLVDTNYEGVDTSYSSGAFPSVFLGFMLPLFGIRYAWKLAMVSWRCSLCYIRCAQVQVCSFTSRVWKTLRGSSDDIGWLKHASGMPPIKDGTERFLELLSHIRNGEHTLPNSFVYLLIPGLFSNHGPLYFVGTKRFFSKMGLACHISKIHSEASMEHNAWELKLYIEELYWGSGKRVMLLGHSKGGVDAAAALSMYWSDLKDKVAGLALVQSPYGGTPVASDILREGQIGDKETRRIMELLICKVIKGDIRALEDLTYEKRKDFIMKHKLPLDIPLISFYSETRIAPGVLTTLNHIAHAELPWLPLLKFGNQESDDIVQGGCQVPVTIPISAAMAVCALHLELRYGERSDGVVTCRDAEVPGSVVVRPDRKLDHAWMVYSSKKKIPSEPDACEMCEAILTLLVELGKTKQETEQLG
ncbi:Alpha/beta-Hydrolases superfamily protein [Quillaja saponaria]|uniref:Alpha/beta-Hydrolases superfamily protein n=1 Tax=Quillaja saponaria TaxID=32244 RepID=A0AAD7M477_QUISA|nr:Alpha/beta-Hydrolases superfamily protein [Quillaja saponaria]KAJ7969562.1 Alpha/beta-Hydrolases superfamily protein [Quillaja saponaria]